MPYSIKYKILSSDTDSSRNLRLSRLFTFLQEAAIAHTEELGAGREKTLDKGYLWVVTSQHVKINRLPVYDERIVLESVPGDMMHTFFPRHYRITGKNGEELLTASTLWMLMDAKNRTMLFPEKIGINIRGEAPSWTPFFPSTPKLPANGSETLFTVPYSYVDLNGHMNNTRYFDLAEDLMPSALRAKKIKEILSQYTSEATMGKTIAVNAGFTENEARIAGTGEKSIFKLNLRYYE